MDRYGQPNIFSTDQGVQFTSGDFIDHIPTGHRNSNKRIQLPTGMCYLYGFAAPVARVGGFATGGSLS
jgi:hypothetical protein